MFTCIECKGEGQVEVGNRDYGDLEWWRCEVCNGDGVLRVDEDEAAEMIDCGVMPDSAPAGYSAV